MDLLMKKSSLFKQQKNAPAFLDGQEKLRLSLLKKLAEAIKEAQLLYATRKHESAIVDCRATQRLCARFENVLRHGLKGGWFGQATSFWPVVLKISRKQAIKYINGLQYAQSDSGRCRAWIRLAVNECSLESYISVLCQDDALLGQYYEIYSCLRNAETMSALKQLLAGLSQLTFNITVDTASLEFEAAPEALEPALRVQSLQNTQRGQEHVKRSPEPGEEAGEDSDGSVSSGNEGSHIAESSKMKAHHSHGKPEPFLDHALLYTLQHEAPDTVNHDMTTVGHEAPDSLSDQVLKLSQTDSALDDGSSVSDKEGEGEDRGKEKEEEEEKEKEEEDEEEQGEEEEEEEERREVREETGGNGRERQETAAEGIQCEQLKGECFLEKNKDRSPSPVDSNPAGSPSTHVESSHIAPVSDSAQNFPFVEEPPTTTTYQASNPFDQDFESPDTNVYQLAPNPFDTLDEIDSIRHDDVTSKPVPTQESFNVPPNPFGSHSTDCSTSGGDPLGGGDLGEDPLGGGDLGEDPLGGGDLGDDPLGGGDLGEDPLGGGDLGDDPLGGGDLGEDPLGGGDLGDDPLGGGDLGDDPLGGGDLGEDPLGGGDLGDDPLGGGDLSGDRGLHYNDSLLKDGSPPGDTGLLGDGSLPGDTSLPGDGGLPEGLTRDKGLLGDRGLWEDDSLLGDRGLPRDRKLLEDEYLSNFAPDTTSRSSSLALSYSLEATLDHALFPETNPSRLQLQEDHFPPELSIADHGTIIQRLKDELASCPKECDRDNLRKKIVQLQLRLQKMKENEVIESHEEICGHQFVRQPPQSRVLLGMMCEGCGKRVTGLIRTWYLCKVCHGPCHKSCLAGVSRMCIGSKEVSYMTEICPEKGLTHQHFRCARCNRALNKQQIHVEARVCDYSGLYYCPACHKRDQAIIPARVLHNWDFTPRTVCCQCSDLLGRLFSRPLLRVQEANPLLYTYVQDLVTVEALRQNILYMKKYFVQCKAALEARLLQKLDPFPHFKEDSCLFSLSELEALHTGRLLPELQEIHEIFAQHIRQDCPVCSGKGYFCEVCASEEVLFPFDRHVSICKCCTTVYHKVCFSEKSLCSKCYRLGRRHE